MTVNILHRYIGPASRLGGKIPRLGIRLLEAIALTLLVPISSLSASNRYLDESFKEPSVGTGPNILVGLSLLAGVMWLCFAIPDLRKLGYVVSALLLLLGFSGASDYLAIAIPVLLASAAGTMRDRKLSSKSPHAHLGNHLHQTKEDAPAFFNSTESYRKSETVTQDLPKQHMKQAHSPDTGLEKTQTSRCITEKSYMTADRANEIAADAQQTPLTAPAKSRMKMTDSLRAKVDQIHEPIQSAFSPPTIIEDPSPAICDNRLVEAVGMLASNGEFTCILEKLSMLPHSRTIRIPLPKPILEPVSVQFARRKSAFRPEYTTLGEFLLTGFSDDEMNINILEIRLRAEEPKLSFDFRDSAGSRLEVTWVSIACSTED